MVRFPKCMIPLMQRNYLNISVTVDWIPWKKFTCYGNILKFEWYSHMRKLANSFLKKEIIQLDRIGKNNHLGVLEIDQRDTTIWKAFVLKTHGTVGKNNGTLWHSFLGLLPFSLPCLVSYEGSVRLGHTVRTHLEASCLCIGSGKGLSGK